MRIEKISDWKDVNAKELIDIACSDFDDVVVMFPELAAINNFEQNNPYHKYTVSKHTQEAIRYFEKLIQSSKSKGKMLEFIYSNIETDVGLLKSFEKLDAHIDDIRIALLFHDSGKAESYSVEVVDGKIRGHFYQHHIHSEKLMRFAADRIGIPKSNKEFICSVIYNHNIHIRPDYRCVKRIYNKFGENVGRAILWHNLCDSYAKGVGSKHWLDNYTHAFQSILQFEKVVESASVMTVKDLAITGHDLQSLGVPQGPEIGYYLKIALNKVMHEGVQNDRDTLLNLVRKLVKSDSRYKR